MTCPRCDSRKSWLLKSGRRRCARCRFDWTPGRLPLRLTQRQWRAILQWFVRGSSSAQIAHETHLDRKRVLRALAIVRKQMGRSMPIDVSTIGDSEDRQEALPDSEGASKTRPRSAVLGLRTSHGLAWAEVVSDEDTAQITRLFRERKTERSDIQWPGAQRSPPSFVLGPWCWVQIWGSDRGRRTKDLGLALGRFEKRARFGHVESFWSYLRVSSRPKAAGEYAWRYNHAGCHRWSSGARR